ncbi:MAG: hypothetical protein ABI439_01155 [Rhodospirillales bacterium]
MRIPDLFPADAPMFDALASAVSSIFNRRGSSLSVPILDGALKPNNLLDEASIVVEKDGIEDIAIGSDGEIYVACGNAVMRLAASGELEQVAQHEHAVTALAALGDGTLAVGLGAKVVLGKPGDQQVGFDQADGRKLNAVTALHATADGALLVCDASATRSYGEWNYDLMEKGHTGRLVRYDPVSGTATTAASGLAYAFGAFKDRQGRILVSETWRHQVDHVKDGHASPVVPALPGYPARIAAAEGGGFWLTLFACRTQLVEFVLQENDYRHEMMRTIEPRYWVAPALRSGVDFREPLQTGGVKQMGILKPWAPPRSYGLVVRFNDDFIPIYSLHSRVGGRHHGIVAVAQRGDDLYVLSKGAGRILRLSVAQVEAQEAAESGE